MGKQIPNVVLCMAEKIIQETFPRTSSRGRKPSYTIKTILQEIFHLLRTGSQWRETYAVPYATVFRYFKRWSGANIFRATYDRVYQQTAHYTQHSKSLRRFLSLDGSLVKSVFGRDVVGANPTDRGRNGSKVSALVDETGLPISICFDKANTADITLAMPTLSELAHVPLPKEKSRKRAIYILADRGYDSRVFRLQCRKRGCIPVIPYRKRVGNQPQPKLTAREKRIIQGRNVVERFFAWLDQYRRVLVRYEKTLAHYESFIWLASSCIASNRVESEL